MTTLSQNDVQSSIRKFKKPIMRRMDESFPSGNVKECLGRLLRAADPGEREIGATRCLFTTPHDLRLNQSWTHTVLESLAGMQ